jgi:hypothetical protein
VVDVDQPVVEQVPEQHPDHAEGQVEVGGDLGDRLGLGHPGEDRQVLRLEAARLRGGDGLAQYHVREQVEVGAGRAGAASGDGVGPDDRSGRVVDPGVVLSRHRSVPGGSATTGTGRPG